MKLFGEVFGKGKAPPPWDSKEPILVNKADPKAVLRKIVVDIPADRFMYLNPRQVILEAKGPDDTSINRMDMLREMIRTAYQQKKWTEKDFKDFPWHPGFPEPGDPWMYSRISENMFDEGLEINYDRSSKDSVYLTLNYGT